MIIRAQHVPSHSARLNRKNKRMSHDNVKNQQTTSIDDRKRRDFRSEEGRHKSLSLEIQSSELELRFSNQVNRVV